VKTSFVKKRQKDEAAAAKMAGDPLSEGPDRFWLSVGEHTRAEFARL
jgi:hypothetical protein